MEKMEKLPASACPAWKFGDRLGSFSFLDLQVPIKIGIWCIWLHNFNMVTYRLCLFSSDFLCETELNGTSGVTVQRFGGAGVLWISFKAHHRSTLAGLYWIEWFTMDQNSYSTWPSACFVFTGPKCLIWCTRVPGKDAMQLVKVEIRVWIKIQQTGCRRFWPPLVYRQ